MSSAESAGAQDHIEALRTELEQARRSAPPLDWKAYASYVSGEVKLPTVPKVTTLLLPLLKQANTPMASVVELLEMDQVLLSVMLRCANSAIHFRGRQITNIRDAVMRIGLHEAACLALSLSTRKLYDDQVKQAMSYVGFDLDTEWRRSVIVAQASRRIASELNRGIADLAYGAGLFHSVGKSLACYVLYSLREAEPSLDAMSQRDRSQVVLRMRGVLMGEYLLREGLPADLCRTCLDVDALAEKPVEPTTHVVRLTLGLVAALLKEQNEQAIYVDRAFASAQSLGFDRDTLGRTKQIILQARDSVDELGKTVARRSSPSL